MRKIHISRRELLLACPTLALFPTIAFATIPPPPSSPWYLIFIADGIYRITNFYIVDLPPSAGTAQNYNKSTVSIEIGKNFTFTNRNGTSAWNMLTGSPIYKWWEVYDKRTDRLVRIWEKDLIEVRFADKSRVKVVFNGPFAPTRFEAIFGTERLPDGTRLYPRLGDRDGSHEGRERGDRGSGPISVTPGTKSFSWSWASQDLPW